MERGERYDKGEVALAGFAHRRAEEVDRIATVIEQALADPEGTWERERALSVQKSLLTNGWQLIGDSTPELL